MIDPRDLLTKVPRSESAVPRLRLGRQLGRKPAYFLHHPDHVQHVLQHNASNYTKTRKKRPACGQGLLTSEGERWFAQRRSLQKAFQASALAPYIPVITECTQRAIARWDEGSTVDLSTEMTSLVIQITGHVLFGMDLEPVAERLAWILRVLAEPRHSVFSWLRYKEALAEVREIVALICREGPSGSENFLQLVRETPECGDQVSTFLLAGMETEINLLVWAFYLLARHPEEQIRAQAEASPGYCRAILQETLRLYPPSSVLTRQAIADDKLGNLLIPAGAVIVISPYLLHRSPLYWESPEAFRPERFLCRTPRAFTYLPFGGGPRACIGHGLAMMEAEIVLDSYLRRFSLRKLNDEPLEPAFTFSTLRPRSKLFLRAVER